jgi:gas vesicle protein
MNKLLSWAIGFAIGAVLGAMLIVLFSPVSGSQWVDNLKRGYNETMEEGRRAAETRRAELEAQLHSQRAAIKRR